MEEMRNRVGRITSDLNALLNEITIVREGSCERLESVLTPEVITGFKTSVDAMRRLLWIYAEAALRQSAEPAVHSPSLQGAREVLSTLQGLSAPVPLTRGTGSFIEKVEAIVEERISAKHLTAGHNF